MLSPLLLLFALGQAPPAQPVPLAPAPRVWPRDAPLRIERTLTFPDLGSAQGFSYRDGKLYAYGDRYDVSPRVGVIREYSMAFVPTGRVIRLTRKGRPAILHPTGLTWHPEHGCFLGDTVLGKGTVFHLDWDAALADGTLDRAVLDLLDDDAAVNGCRPEFVTLAGKSYIATADYGDIRPEVRLLDPAALLRHGRSTAPGVVVHRIACGPFNQNLHWDAERGQLVLVQNAVAGLGWQLDRIDLAKAVADGRADGPGVRVGRRTYPPGDELEGWRPFPGGRQLFLTSSRENNVTLAAGD